MTHILWDSIFIENLFGLNYFMNMHNFVSCLTDSNKLVGMLNGNIAVHSLEQTKESIQVDKRLNKDKAWFKY